MEPVKNIFEFPDPLIDPKDKGKDFIMQYGKAMFNTFRRSGFRMFYNNRTKYREEILYAQGDQSVDQYKQRLDCWEDKDSSYLNLDWQILNLCSKFVNVVQGKLNKVDVNIVCTAIDALATDQKKDYLARLQAYKELSKWAEEHQIELSKDFGKDQPPINMEDDEQEIFMNMSLKHRWSMSMEKAINAVLNSNDFSQTKKELIWDLIVLGVGVVKITETKKGTPLIEKCNPENIIISNAQSEKFKNREHVGEVKMMTPEEYFKRAGDIYTREEKEYILTNHLKKYSQSDTYNIYNNSSIGTNQSGMLEVLDFVFTSPDTMVHEKKRDKRGNKKIYRKKFSYPSKMSMEEYDETYKGEREVIKTTYDSNYKGLWIIGSDFLCDYGPIESSREENYVDCFFPYVLIAPNMQHGITISMVRQMIPVLNFIQLNWLKYNDAIARAKPKGAGIDLDALESIALGKGGKNFTPAQVIDLWEKKGIVVFRRKGMAHEGANGHPIEELDNGMAADAPKFFENIIGGVGLLRDITGLNDVTDASTPDPKLLKSVAEAAMAGTNNAVDHLYHGINQIYQDLCRQLSTSIVNGVKNGTITDLDDAIGGATTRFFGENSDITAHKYGIKIENKPSQDEWNGFYATLQVAVQNGLIDASDEAFCREIDNLKEARQYLIVRERKKADRAAQEAQAQTEAAAQANQQAAQETLKMQKEATAIEIEGKIRLEQEKRATVLAVELEKRKTILLQTEMQLHGKNENKLIEGDMKTEHIEQKGEYDLAAQHIKNQKPKEKSAS